MSSSDSEFGAGVPAAERAVPVAELGSGLAETLRRRLAQLHRFEMRIVGLQCSLGARRPWCTLSEAINRLGNGWLYLLLAGVLLFVGTRQAHGVILHGGLAAAAAHAVYPWIKRRIGRLRPFELMPQWQGGTPVLDRYSFPSGHCMTATAVAIPLAQAFPHLVWGIAAAGAVIAWARVACAHHYPSDLLAGFALGATSAYVSGELLAWLQAL